MKTMGLSSMTDNGLVALAKSLRTTADTYLAEAMAAEERAKEAEAELSRRGVWGTAVGKAIERGEVLLVATPPAQLASPSAPVFVYPYDRKPAPDDPRTCATPELIHDYDRMQEDQSYVREKCTHCNAQRWAPVRADDPEWQRPSEWFYTAPPGPPAPTVVTDEEAEDFVSVDGYVPDEISTPQPRHARWVGGRKVEADV